MFAILTAAFPVCPSEASTLPRAARFSERRTDTKAITVEDQANELSQYCLAMKSVNSTAIVS